MAQRKRIRLAESVEDQEVSAETIPEETVETPTVDDGDAAGELEQHTPRKRVKFSNDEEEEAFFEDEYSPDKKPTTTQNYIQARADRVRYSVGLLQWRSQGK